MKKHSNYWLFSFHHLLLLGGCWLLSIPLAGQIDSLREMYAEDYLQGRANPDWRILARSCDGKPACIAATEDWTRNLNDSLLPEFLEYQGDYFILRQRMDEGLAYFHRGLRVAKQQGSVYMQGILHNRLGHVYTHFRTETDSAAYYLYKSITQLEAVAANEIWQPYYNLAFLNRQLNRGEKAVEFMEQAYLSSRKTERRIDYGFVLYHLLSWCITDERKALLDRYLPEYATFREGSRSLDPQHDALLTNIQDNDAGFVALQKYERQLSEGDTAVKSDLDIVYSILGGAYAKRGQYQEALRHYKRSLQLEAHQSGNTARTYRSMIDLGTLMKDQSLIIESMEKYQAIKDSMTQLDYQTSISRLEVEFETQKTEAELVRSELALSETLRQRNQLQLGGVVLLLLMGGGFLFYHNRLKLQELRAVVAQEEQKRELEAVRRQSELSNLRALIEGQETERARVAKDLHDGLGGLLTTVKAHVGNIAGTEEATSLIDRACTSVRRIAHNMVPQSLAESGLVASLNDVAAQLRVQGYEVDLEIIGALDQLFELPEQGVLLRIVQELTHNVVKHAEAKTIMLQLFEQPDRLLLIVEDDGKGFNLDYARRNGGGLGLGSVEQRVAFLEGTLQFDSLPGLGTTVNVELPLKPGK